MRIFFILLILSLNASAKDRSDEFQTFMKKEKIINIKKLQKFKVLVVPGVLAESFDKTSLQPIKLNIAFEQGFADQIKVLKENNIDFEFVKFDTENSPTVNGKIIAKAIMESNKPVLIYSHSKGGLDTLEALMSNPNLMSKIKGWVSVQSPFYGSPVAELFNKESFLKSTTDNLFKWFGGSPSGFHSLTFEERVAYMESSKVQNLVEKINLEINFLNYGSIKKDILGYDSAIELFRDISQNVSGDNDGVVPIMSALMNEHGHDVNYVVENDVDHLMTMTKYKMINLTLMNSLKDYDRKTHTLALLEMIAE